MGHVSRRHSLYCYALELSRKGGSSFCIGMPPAFPFLAIATAASCTVVDTLASSKKASYSNTIYVGVASRVACLGQCQ